jgi:hypothetical protein
LRNSSQRSVLRDGFENGGRKAVLVGNSSSQTVVFWSVAVSGDYYIYLHRLVQLGASDSRARMGRMWELRCARGTALILVMPGCKGLGDLKGGGPVRSQCMSGCHLHRVAARLMARIWGLRHSEATRRLTGNEYPRRDYMARMSGPFPQIQD